MEQRPRDDYVLRLDGLIREGREFRTLAATDRPDPSTIAAIRSWQQQCAATVNALSGGSKVHWLARAFSQAFLVRSIAGDAVAEAPLSEIVARVVGVLEHAMRSLAQMADAPSPSRPAARRARRFEFVHNTALRPVLEEADEAARIAFEQGRFAESLITTCGVLEAIITDALEQIGESPHEWSFDARIAAAERAGLIRGGCTRLPPAARTYRQLTAVHGELPEDGSVTEHDARVTRQVLHIVIRDLDPGR